MDGNKISHKDPVVVTMIIDKLKGHFRKTTVTRRKEHIFLGINIKYHTDNCTAVVSIKSYLQQAIDECGLEIRREASTPARCTFSRWIKDLLFLKWRGRGVS